MERLALYEESSLGLSFLMRSYLCHARRTESAARRGKVLRVRSALCAALVHGVGSALCAGSRREPLDELDERYCLLLSVTVCYCLLREPLDELDERRRAPRASDEAVAQQLGGRPVPHMVHGLSRAPSGRCTVWECTTCGPEAHGREAASICRQSATNSRKASEYLPYVRVVSAICKGGVGHM